MTYAYRMKVARMWREFDLPDLGQIPKEIVLQATGDSLIWDTLAWGNPSLMPVLDQAPMRLIKDLYQTWQADSGLLVEEELFQILAVIERHSAPLEADLIDKAMRLRDFPSERHSWHDLWVIINHLGYHSHLFAAMYPERAGWDKTNMLLADIADSNNWIMWSKTKDAQDGGSPPDPILRPGVKLPEKRKGSKVKPSPISRIRELAGLDKRHENQTEQQRFRSLEAVFR